MERRTLYAAVLSNQVLLVVVFVFNWNPRLLLLLYWFEAGVIILRDAVQGVFADLPPSDDFNSPMAPFPFEILTPYGAVVGVGLVVALRALAQLAVSWVVGSYTVYRIYPDAVVEWNELTGQPQWVMARDEITEVSVASGRLRSLFPDWFGTVRLSGFSDDSRLIGYVSDPEAIADLLNR